MTRTKHWESCEAPICMDAMEESTMWYPDEPICSRRHSTKIQRTQRKIQKFFNLGELKHGDHLYFTVKDLEEVQRIRREIKGMDPDATLEFHSLVKELKSPLEDSPELKMYAQEDHK